MSNANRTVEQKTYVKNSIWRLIIAFIAFLIEMFIIVFLANRVSVGSTIQAVEHLIGILLALFISNQDKTSSIKISWIILVLLFPIIGGTLYLITGTSGTTKRMRRRYEEIDKKLFPLLPDQHNLVEEKKIAAIKPATSLSTSLMISSEAFFPVSLIGADFLKDISAGEIIKIDDTGYKIGSFCEASNIAIESMEFIYFARPDSTIMGKNVHSVRKNSGRVLAREYPVEADIVVGVPNSSLSLATGYAEEIGLPYEMGLIKNQYIGRTFIEPSQNLRDIGVKMKLSALADVVRGKRVILLDDSIVRGTTSKRIISMLKKAGASEVHLRIGSPEIVFPSYSGIDMKTSKELIAANMSKEEIRELIGADSLEFLSVEGLKEAVGFDFDSPNKGVDHFFLASEPRV